MDQKRKSARPTCKRSSYFETLSSVTSQLDFMREDLNSSHPFDFAPTSPLDLGSNVKVQTSELLFSQPERPPEPLYDKLPVAGQKSTIKDGISPAGMVTKGYTEPFNFSAPPPPSHIADQDPQPEMTLRSRLLHTKLVWFLPNIQRPAAMHYLQGQPMGTFIVRSSSSQGKLSLSMKHPGTVTHGAFINHINIIASPDGYRLDKEEEVFPTLDELILHHFQDRGVLPCPLDLPHALKAAKTGAELQSFAILEEEFWKSPHSRLHTHKQLTAVQRSHRPQFLPESSSFQVTIQGSNPLGYDRLTATNLKNDLMDTRDPKERILSLYNAENRPISRHSWASDGSDDHWAKVAAHGHRRTSSDVNRQVIRYSSEAEQLDLSYLERRPPPSYPPPSPPVDQRLSFNNPYQDPSTDFRVQQGRIFPTVNGQSSVLPYPPRTTSLSSDGSSVRSHSTISDDSLHSMGRDSTCSSRSSQSRQSNISIPSYYLVSSSSRFSDSFSLLPNLSQQSDLETVESQESKESPKKVLPSTGVESPYDTPSTVPISDTRPADVPSEAASNEDTNLLDLSFLDSIIANQESSVTEQNPLSEFDPLLVPNLPPPAEFGDNFRRSLSFPMTQQEENRSSSELSGEYDVIRAGESLPGSSGEGEGTSDEVEKETEGEEVADEDEGEAAKQDIKKMQRCVSLPAPLMRGTDSEGVFHGSKSEYYGGSEEAIQEDSRASSMGEEDFEFVNRGSWSSENVNSNRSIDEDEGSSSAEKVKHKKGKKLSQLRNMAKKSTKKVPKKFKPHKWKKKLDLLDPAASIQEVVKRLAVDPQCRLGAMVESFISSTVDKCETHKPDAVLKSLRQFMTGVKNYLFNNQEVEVEAQLDKYCDLTGMEVDAIFESALHQVLLERLKDDIYLCFIRHFNESGSLTLLDRNIRSAKEMSCEELGIKGSFIPPSRNQLAIIKEKFTDIQRAYSPLQKLEHLLHVVKAIYSSVTDPSLGRNAVTSMGADDFLPMLIYVLVHCDQIHIEIEVEYMWGLLDPSLLSGEGGYYLTTLSSAICVLKQFEEETETETKGFVTVLVARGDGDITMKTVPVLPAMTSVEVCNFIIQKLDLDTETPNQIFLLSEGTEQPLESHCSIYKIKTDYEAMHNKLCKFCIRPENITVKWPVISTKAQSKV